MTTYRDKEDVLTSQDLEKILEVNSKAIEINIEVGQQNILILEALKELKNYAADLEKQNIKLTSSEDLVNNKLNDVLYAVKEINNKINKLDNFLFKLVLVLGTIDVGLIVSTVKLMLK